MRVLLDDNLPGRMRQMLNLARIQGRDIRGLRKQADKF